MVRLPRSGRAAVVLALVALLVAPSFRVEAQSAEAQAAAEALFREGRRLMDEGLFGEACRKFEASYELDVAMGTLLNLAHCFELDGRLASAWARFLEAETLARRAGSDQREAVARQRASALEPRLVRLRLRVSEPVRGLRIDVAGREFSRALWNTSIPIDPGEFNVVVSAPGYERWAHTARTQGEGSTVDVEVPQLTPAPPEEVTEVIPDSLATPVAAEPPRAPRSPRRILGFTGLGVGIATVGVGLGVGQSARSLWSSADCTRPRDMPGETHVCDSIEAKADADAAGTRAHMSTGLVVVGGALLTAGLVVLLTGRNRDDDSYARVRVTPFADRHTAGLTVGGNL